MVLMGLVTCWSGVGVDHQLSLLGCSGKVWIISLSFMDAQGWGVLSGLCSRGFSSEQIATLSLFWMFQNGVVHCLCSGCFRMGWFIIFVLDVSEWGGSLSLFWIF